MFYIGLDPGHKLLKVSGSEGLKERPIYIRDVIILNVFPLVLELSRIQGIFIQFHLKVQSTLMTCLETGRP